MRGHSVRSVRSMLATALCIIAFAVCFALAKRALWAGFVATIALGYLYGVLRANLDQPPSHFIFDTGALGLYLALFMQPLSPRRKDRMRALAPWVVVLIGWPLMLFFVPVQDPLVQLVGLRGQIFFVPFLLFGAIFTGKDLTRIARCVALLNCTVLVFALLETRFGIAGFYPRNAVDEIIYHSHDVLYGGALHFRIPATFTSSAAYAGTMVISAPLLLGAISAEPRNSRWRYLLLGAVALSAVGVFLAASRSAAFFEFLMIGLFIMLARTKNIPLYAWLAMGMGVALLVWATPRMQRFLTLADAHFIADRLRSSVNGAFFQMAEEYPLGNGLGGGGTSIPYFLSPRLKDAVALENEYGLIMLEQGIPGLALWLAFIFWLLARPLPRRLDNWYTGRCLARVFCTLSFATAPLGNGMLSAIPQTAILLLYAGWIATPQREMASSRLRPDHSGRLRPANLVLHG